MQRNTRSKQTVKVAVDKILICAIADLSVYLGGFAEILSAETSNPREFRAVSKRIRQYAEHYLVNDILFTAAIRQVCAIVEKLPTWGAITDVERESKAFEGFMWAEQRCRRYNKKLKWYRANWCRVPKSIRQVLNMAIDRCHRALGPADIDWGDCGWGPGVTFDTGKSIHEKLSCQTVTPGAKSHVLEILASEYPRWSEHLVQSGARLKTVKGDRISFAPKSADIVRVLGIQCSLNVFAQKAVEKTLTSLALGLGVTINDQSRNTKLLGRWDEVATIDLKAASECIARECVSLFFPPDWVAVFKALSSPMYMRKEGKNEIWRQYEKLMPQGNCITFPMESILFNCVAFAATEYCGGDTDLVRTYGDDIIVPKAAALLVVETLEWLGLKVNTDKTHITGPFRETCGVDVLHGVDIRPVYVRKVPKCDSELADLFNRLLANKMGFYLGTTLAYLHDCALKPLYGPAYTRASEGSLMYLEGDVLSTWYKGKSRKSASYFWSPTPVFDWVVCHSGNHPIQVQVLEAWDRKVLAKTSGNEAVDYHAFLLGNRRGYASSGYKDITVLTPLFGGWDVDENLQYPDVYPETRRVSDRVLRRVTRAVIGARIF